MPRGRLNHFEPLSPSPRVPCAAHRNFADQARFVRVASHAARATDGRQGGPIALASP